MTKEDIIFTAGFFLGEGNIRVSQDVRGSFIGVVGISQLDREPLERLRQLWGGTAEMFMGNGKPTTWRWYRNGGKALPCLEAILPIVRDWSTFNTQRIEKYIEFYAIDSTDWRARSTIVQWFKTCVENHRKACHAYLDACYAEKQNSRR